MDKTLQNFKSALMCDKAKKIYKQIPLVLSVLFAAFSFFVVIYYTVFPAEGYFHSDCTDTIFWAQASADSGKVFDPNFIYAAMLPFGASVWLIPLIKIFGVTMATHVAGMVIFACLFFASIIFVCRSMGWSWNFTLISSGTVMLIMSSSDKLREIMWGHVIYYSLGLLILFTGLGLLIRMYKNFELGKKKKAYVYAALLFLLTMLGATNGFQCIAIYTLPLIVAIVAEAVFNSKDKLISARNSYLGFGALLLIAATLLGYIILMLVRGDIRAGYADAYSSFEDVSKWTSQLLKFPESYFSLMGVKLGDDTATAFLTLVNLIKAVASLVILILPVMLLFLYKKIEDMGTKLLLWAHITVTAVIMAGFVCGKLSAANWRLTPIVGTSILTSIAAIRTMISLKGETRIVWRRLGAVFMIVPILFSFVNAKEITGMPKDYGKDNELHRLSAFLEENDLEYGYATFWYSQALTLISDSEVRVRCINADSKSGVTPYYYQTNFNWYKDQEGVDKYFVALNTYEASSAMYNTDWKYITDEYLKETLIFENFRIYVFDRNVFSIEKPSDTEG